MPENGDNSGAPRKATELMEAVPSPGDEPPGEVTAPPAPSGASGEGRRLPPLPSSGKPAGAAATPPMPTISVGIPTGEMTAPPTPSGEAPPPPAPSLGQPTGEM